MRRLAVCLAVLAVMMPWSARAQSADVRLVYRVGAGESGRVAHDSSGHHNNGRLRGGVSRYHGSYRFHRLALNHKFDRITTPKDPSLNPGSSPFSYGAKLKVSPDARWLNREMAVIRHGDSETPGGNYKLEIKKSKVTGKVSAFCAFHDQHKGYGYVRGTGHVVIDDGRWHVISCSRDSVDTVSLHVDAAVVTRTVRRPLGDVSGPTQLLIGCQHQGRGLREQFVGRMDDINITVN